MQHLIVFQRRYFGLVKVTITVGDVAAALRLLAERVRDPQWQDMLRKTAELLEFDA